MSKDFFEAADGLPMKGKQAFFDHVVKQVLGKPTEPLLVSKSLSISNSSDIEEEIMTLALDYGIDHNRIDREEYRKVKDACNTSKIRVKEIIDSVPTSVNGQRNKFEELVCLAKFLYSTDTKMQITPYEKPDFILSHENGRIGIEHSRLTLFGERQLFSIICKEIILPIEEIVRQSIPTGLVNLTIDVDIPVKDTKKIRNFKSLKSGSDLIELRESLADYIIQFCNNTPAQKPAFVHELHFQANTDRFSLSLSDTSVGSPDFTLLLSDLIENKEEKLQNYREGQGFKAVWLLIEFDTSQLHSRFDIDYSDLQQPIYFTFDRVVLINSTTVDCYEIFPGKTKIENITKNGIPPLIVPPLFVV